VRSPLIPRFHAHAAVVEAPKPAAAPAAAAVQTPAPATEPKAAEPAAEASSTISTSGSFADRFAALAKAAMDRLDSKM
jgi:hypothetical protein